MVHLRKSYYEARHPRKLKPVDDSVGTPAGGRGKREGRMDGREEREGRMGGKGGKKRIER